jgi:hypothetical protein
MKNHTSGGLGTSQNKLEGLVLGDFKKGSGKQRTVLEWMLAESEDTSCVWAC